MILEGLVSTLDGAGVVNLAPMGPMVAEENLPAIPQLTFRPFQTSRTFRNLKQTGVGVFHITDDVLLLAQATVGDIHPPVTPAKTNAAFRLADCHRFLEFRVICFDDSTERATIVAHVEHDEILRGFVGFNRAKGAVVEAAILASRVKLLAPEFLRAEFARLATIVDKTAGAQEREAFAFLKQHIETADPSILQM